MKLGRWLFSLRSTDTRSAGGGLSWCFSQRTARLIAALPDHCGIILRGWNFDSMRAWQVDESSGVLLRLWEDFFSCRTSGQWTFVRFAQRSPVIPVEGS
jgi:hypothetical protein